jgi:flagellar biosynthesis protein
MKHIINPPDIAVALKYDGANAPTVIAKGQGELAREIIELATQHDIPLDTDPELVKLLSSIPLGEQIPQELYIAVAEVIAFAYMLSEKVPEGFEPAR